MRSFYNDILDNIVAFRILGATGVLLIVFGLGSIGYHFIEGMNFFDGFYMTFITITTIGFSELKNLTDGGRILTMVLFVMGIGVISYIASQTTQLIFESELFRKRAMKKQLEKMKNHYIICGYGRIGHRIGQVLKDADIPIVVVENRDSSIERIRDDRLLYVEGDAQEESVLIEAGIKRAKGLICTLSRDQDNVFVTLIARELNKNIFILVRTNQRANTKKILRSGANKVISPYEVGADRMANVILRPHVDQFMDQIQGGAHQDHIFDEVKVFEGAELAGKTLAEARIRQKYFVVIIAIIPEGDVKNIKFNPGSEDKINEGDSLIVLGDIDRIEQLRAKGCEDNRTLEERVSRHDYLQHIYMKT
ncbi:potassium channel protein [Aliifodinibius sp. S!AR15-10]|uniref:potassium channel family protein n=1 Tax=Aliifodinibius sp. S!AR15-10 TaxID=2950437 RepID=UPI00285C4F56|nr:potassium channel protein [Aliifodinibius sp. S!AR15-10]MDR8392685.1 potassium channel protein [Aliifodinibius sp. S!AR15-10]